MHKPWGREIWFSGIEARGESGVDCAGEHQPLSLVLEKLGRDEPVTLLKRLVPSTGNLYVEVHRTKHEVYFAEAAGEVLAGTSARPERLREAASIALRLGDTDAIEKLLTRIMVEPGMPSKSRPASSIRYAVASRWSSSRHRFSNARS